MEREIMSIDEKIPDPVEIRERQLKSKDVQNGILETIQDLERAIRNNREYFQVLGSKDLIESIAYYFFKKGYKKYPRTKKYADLDFKEHKGLFLTWLNIEDNK